MKNIIFSAALLAATALSVPAFAQTTNVQSQQNNDGTVTAVVNLNKPAAIVNAPGNAAGPGPVISIGTATGSAVAVGNSLNVVAVTAINSDGRVIDQRNTGAITATANTGLNGTGGGYVNNSALAVGNSISVTADAIGLGQGNGAGAVTQFNNGAQTATVGAGGTFNTTGRVYTATAVGNVINLASPSATLSATQTNAGNQTATANPGGAFGTVNAGAAALGNLFAPTNATVGGAALTQQNSGTQLASVAIQPSGEYGQSTMTALAVGNAIQFAQATPVGFNGSQNNTGAQTASITGNNDAAGSFGSQAFGNLFTVSQGGAYSASVPQNNSGNVSASVVTSQATGNLSSLAGGNFLQISAGSAPGVFANQTNTGNISSLTSVSGVAGAALTATATSIGNSTSVTTR